MKLSTRTRYGTRLMLELAVHYQSGYVQLSEIAKNQEISEKYSEQIITALRTSGLVSSLRGAHGGYMLSKPPDQISLRDIVSTLEGTLAVLDCLDGQDCNRAGACISRKIWSKLTRSMEETLSGITLYDMLQEYYKTNDYQMYEI